MASRNINKIKPWMLSKNTNEILNSYVQKIYKQMPMSFNKDLKTIKMASARPENRGPLSTWKNQQRQMPSAVITPRTAVMKKSSSKMKQQTHNNLMNLFHNNKANNPQVSSKLAINNLTPSKRLLKTPNYKIYKTLRYGSSCSSSRSSLLKRYDDRKRQRQGSLAQINYLIRSFHTSKFEPTYARFLMPARNQQLDTNLGSIPDAIKFSQNMIKDLMDINNSIKVKKAAAVDSELSAKSIKCYNLEQWNHPPTLSKFKIKSPKDTSIKNVSSAAERNMRKAKISPENRNYARINISRASQFKHPKTPNELFTAQHDRTKTELHEKHRRNRMKKLGLIKSPTPSEKLIEDIEKNIKGNMKQSGKPVEEQKELIRTKPGTESVLKQAIKKVPKLANQPHSKPPSQPATEVNNGQVEKPRKSVKTKNEVSVEDPEKNPMGSMPAKKGIPKQNKHSCIPRAINAVSTKTVSNKYSNFISSGTVPTGYTKISPIVAVRAQMPHKNDSGSYRYHRHDFFSTKKY